MQRVLQPEILDRLPHDHPDALHNRRDLRLTNWVAGNHRWISRTLARLARPGDIGLEIGSGTGELGLQLARRGLAVDALDLWPRPAHWPAERQWHNSDLRNFDGYGRYQAIVGNLIFHQFSAAELGALGEKLQHGPRVIVACEPERRRVSQLLFRGLGPLFGANYVSLHDAHVSIAAGFRGEELANALGLGRAQWNVRCSTTLLGFNRMAAVRHA